MNVANSNNLFLNVISVYVAKLNYLIEESVNLSVLKCKMQFILWVFPVFQFLVFLYLMVQILFCASEQLQLSPSVPIS